MKERQNEYRRKGEKEKHEFKSKNLINFSPYPYHRLAISLLCLSQPGPRLPSVSFTPFSLPVYHQNHLSPNTLENLNCWNVFITMWKGWKFGEKSSLKLEKKKKERKNRLLFSYFSTRSTSRVFPFFPLQYFSSRMVYASTRRISILLVHAFSLIHPRYNTENRPSFVARWISPRSCICVHANGNIDSSLTLISNHARWIMN